MATPATNHSALQEAMPIAQPGKKNWLNLFRKQQPVSGHIFFWLLYICYLYIVNKTLLSGKTVFIDVFIANLLSIWTFYSSYYFWLQMLGDKNMPKSALALLVSISVFYAGRYIYIFILVPAIGLTPYTEFNSKEYIRGCIVLFMQYFLLGMGYYFSVRSALKEKQLRKALEEKQKIENRQRELEQHNTQLEQQNLQTEYAFLRSQINPHFLQNTLNFFYSKSLTCSEELSAGILTLSEIMRYSLNTKANEAPPLLTDELKQMNNVININQMRFGNRLQIKYEQNGDPEGIRIIPLILITLVENAFKHGELGNPEHPLHIRLNISEYQESLELTVSNLKKTGPKDKSHGIGLENIRRRLQLVYGNGAELKTRETATDYSITLNIKQLHP